jgi:hypothetical protein
LVDEIVRTAFQSALLQPQLRRERQDREASAQRASKLRAQKQWRCDARAEQLKQTFLMMEANARVRQLKALLDQVEQASADLLPPFDKRTKVWVIVVRAEPAARSPSDEILHSCLSVQSWATWPPAWWPAEAPHTPGSGEQS